MEELKGVLLAATKEAGKIIQQYFNTAFRIDHKDGINNLVTEVDKLSESRIIDVIRAAYPAHTIISEEAGELIKPSDYQWIIDPIDGTVNFAHGIPICCVSIGLMYKKELVLGAVY